MAAAEVECVFHGAFFLRKLPVLENVFFFFFFFSKIGVILTFPLH